MITSRPPTDLARLVARYASRLHATIGDRHHVASPLGAWLLLALVGPLADGPDRAAIEDVLGCPIEAARAAVDDLMASPGRTIGLALAGWADVDRVGATIGAWLEVLPPGTDRGPIPSPADADRWARDHTRGLIERFPIEVDPSTILVLASALATKVAWAIPFEDRPATELGGPFVASVDHVLHTGVPHETQLARTPTGQLIAAVRKIADGLTVVAVLARPDLEPTAVLGAAHWLASGEGRHHQLSLFDVPIGASPVGTITQRTYTAVGPGGRVETAEAWLPAWTATSDHDLLADERFGFAAASRIVGRKLPALDAGYAFDARQSATASYGRLGFEAAAVTAFATRAGAAFPREQEVTERHLEVRFDRPFAVVATATAGHDSPWADLPVFSAWVADAVEPSD
jgi:hypothetical protein